MMFKTTRDVLDRVRSFHHILNNFYLQLSDKSNNRRIKILLEYLSEHENRSDNDLAKFEKGASDRILDTWFKFLPDEDKLKGCEEMELAPDISVEDVVRLVHRVEDCLIQFYKEIAEHCVIKEIKELFTNLLKMEKHEKLNFMRNTQEVYDL